jgi:ferritin
MKTSVIRLKTSLQDSVLDLLNKQMGMEAHSCASYLSMSAWCYAQGLVGCGAYFKKQSGEEREHLLRLFDYVCDMGGMAVSPEVKGIEANFEGLRDIFMKALEMEIAITESFNHITEHCHKNKDFQTAKFVQWYLNEQMEEEQQARRCLEIYDLIGSDLFRIDKEIAKLTATAN